MPPEIRLSHIAFLVDSVHEAAEVPAKFGFPVGPAESWEGEGTLEIYVGDPSHAARLLLMQPEKEGAYKRALRKRGPGLHHIAVDVLDLEGYILSLAGSGWLLHPRSVETMKEVKVAYLARPGFPALIEVQERESLTTAPFFIRRFEMPIVPDQARLLQALGVTEVEASEDKKWWLTCGDVRFRADGLWASVRE
jgi:hypothetical protein